MPNDPREAVLERICAAPPPVIRPGGSKDGAPKSWVRSGMPEPADPETIVFRKERSGVTQRIYAVSYSDAVGHLHFDIVGVNQQADGSWSGGGFAGGSGNGPVRDKPWVNFGGWWGAELFCAGGQVIGTDADHARRVELSFADKTAAEDTVDDGVVLFLIEHAVELPATARIFGADGAHLASQDFP